MYAVHMFYMRNLSYCIKHIQGKKENGIFPNSHMWFVCLDGSDCNNAHIVPRGIGRRPCSGIKGAGKQSTRGFCQYAVVAIYIFVRAQGYI